MSQKFRIGVDVGGTNTDGVVLDPLRTAEPNKGIIAWHKSPTTPNPSDGISDAITSMFLSANIKPEDIASVTIGTTHFVNAVVERDAARLSRVAVIRLSGPFSKHAPPCVDWPEDMRELLLGYFALVKGGLEVDGNLISDIDENEIRGVCKKIKELGIRSVVVNGIFSPIDTVHRQEERAADMVRSEIPGADIVLSKEVANLGFLERENAAILNASILSFAKRTIRSFQDPIKRLGLKCPVFITQNDGTMLSGEMASKLPIRTFSSGPTNSMRGAAFLVRGEIDEAVMVVDIGGTTTDVGLLLKTGFPRQQAAYSELSGVRMNFSCPDIKSIGLGGGSIVRRNEGKITVGPDSVGYRLSTEALIFGGNVVTATDCTVADTPQLAIGNPALAQGALKEEELSEFKVAVKSVLERVIDTMKTAPDDLPVILVGGGAILAPAELKGASRVLKPRWSEVANAVGAAIAMVSAVVDTVKDTERKSSKDLLEEVSKEAIERTVLAGAKRESVKVVEMEDLPMQYIAHKSRFVVRAAGDFDFSRPNPTLDLDAESHASDAEFEDPALAKIRIASHGKVSKTTRKADVDILKYVPNVKNRTWYVNETDLDWITIGCYILGTGGGGSPYSSMIRLRSILRDGGIVRVVNPYDLKDDDRVGCGGGMGSPTVGIEKLQADEMLEAQQELYKLVSPPATHMIAVEIGGGNGLQSMILGSSTHMDIPVVDGDWMGRAYPTKWQTTPVVFAERSTIWAPTSMCDGNGNVVIMIKATSDTTVENVFRAGLSQLGSHVGCADPPVSGAETKRWIVEHTISLSWRIGRAVAKARTFNRMDQVAETIIDEVGGPDSAKVLFKGKIVGVERTLRMGYVYGECIIEGMDMHGEGINWKMQSQFQGKVKIPFKNENIAVIRLNDAGDEGESLAIVPDLIAVIDAHNGEAIGTPEYRYGLLVIVLGITASDRWTGTERGIQLGGPEGFGMQHLTYKPLGKFVKPRSVIDEFGAT